MIYLFDDRQGRRDLHAKFLNRFSAIIKSDILRLNDDGGFDDSLIDNYGDVDLIILHSSYLIKGGKIKSEDIRDYFLNNGIDVVTFSGATDNSSLNNLGNASHYNMNAERMYENLEVFLKDFEFHGKPNVELLMWGNQYALNQILSFQCDLGNLFINDNLNEPISKYDTDYLTGFIEDSLVSDSLKDFREPIVKFIENRMQHSLTSLQLINFTSNLLINFKK